MAKKRTLEDLTRQYSKYGAPKGRGMGMGPRGGGPGGRRRGAGAKGKPKNTGATVRRLWSYIAKYKARLFVVMLCMAASTGTSLAGSYILRPIINKVADTATTAGARIAYLASVLITLAIVYLVGIASTYIQGKMMMTVSQNSIEKLRTDLFDKLQTLPVRYFDSNTTGELMSRFTNDIDNIDTMINNTITSLVSGVITLVGTFAMMVHLNRILTLVTVVFIPLFIFLGGAVAKRSEKYYSAQQAALGALNGYIEETVTGSKVVKVFNHESICEEEFDLLNEDMRKKQFGAQFFGGIMGPIMGNTSKISYAVTAGIGGLLCLAGRFDIGGLAVFCNFSLQFSMPINMISQQTSTIFSALAGAERVFSIMNTTPDEADMPKAVEEGKAVIKPAPIYQGKGLTDEIKGEVVFDHVTFAYNLDKVILKDISLYAHAGQKIAFVGSTGAGKTTITNLLNRFYDINKGKCTIDGKDIRDFDRDYLRRNIAVVLQDTHLFTGTVMENIRYGRLDATDDDVISAAKTASAHSFIMRLSDGYNTMIEGDGSNLSQGQRQLLNIARAALSKAPILVLDEATSSVDTRTERHIEHGMDRLMKNRTTFVIAHRLSTVRNADAIMVLEQGEIIERGSHDDLLEMKGRYYELYTGKKELD